MDNPQLNLKYWSEQIGAEEHSLKNARRLSEGSYRKLLLVGLEPCDIADIVNYNTMIWGRNNFRNFAVQQGSPTLREIDRIIRDIDPLKNLEDVPFFDSNTLMSNNMKERSNDVESDLLGSHRTFCSMVKAQKPDVIVILHCKSFSSQYGEMRNFRTREYLAGTLDIINIDSREVLLVRGFHPSTYLRPDYLDRNSIEGLKEAGMRRKMMEYCFKVAFEATEGRETRDLDFEDEWIDLLSRKYDIRSTRKALGNDKERRKAAKLALLREEHRRSVVERQNEELSALLEPLSIASRQRSAAARERGRAPKNTEGRDVYKSKTLT